MKITLESLAERIEVLEGNSKINDSSLKTTIQEIPAKKLEWGAESPEELNWEEATNWCKNQGDGYRLPTVVELMQAYWEKVPGFTQSNFYWSSTTYPANYSNAMNVNFNNGNANNNGKTNSNYVRCVRALPLPTLSLLRFLHTWRPSSL